MGHVKPGHILISESHNYELIPIILILTNSINLIGCFEVIYRIYCKRCRLGKNFPLSLDSRFSLYIAISNCLFAVMQIIDTVLTGSDAINPGVICDITGNFSPSFLTLNLLSIMSFAYLSYLKICRNIDLSEKTGKYDWKLWKLLFLISLVTTVFGLNRYDPQSLWCANRPEGTAVYLSNIVFITIVLIATFIIYSKLKNSNADHVRMVDKYRPVHPHVVRNIISYLSVFFLQWICVLIYNLTMFYELNDILTKNYFAVLLILAVNIGGVGNAMVYVISDYKTRIIEEDPISSKSYGSLV